MHGYIELFNHVVDRAAAIGAPTCPAVAAQGEENALGTSL
jgi:hypothetical protein